MGFFDGYSGVSDTIANAEEIGYSNPAPGSYFFEVTAVEMQKGNKKDPEALATIIKYQLTDSDDKTRSHSEYYGIPQPADPRNPTEREKQQAGFLKSRLLSLGIAPEKLNTFESDDLIGVEGSLRIVQAKDPQYVSIRDLKLKGSKSTATAQTKAAAPVATKPAPRRAPAKVTQPQPADEGGPVMDHEPEQTEAAPEPPKAKPAQVVGNPFAR